MLHRLKASAGSGKTHELTQRFLKLLAGSRPALHGSFCSAARAGDEAYAWGDILAVTFTNRAAAEMKERVLLRLKEAALGRAPLPAPWTPALAGRWVRNIIRRYGNLNIRTIDSLLQQMVSASALTLGLPPEFTPVYAGMEALSPHLDALLERARRGDGEMCGLLRACCRTLLFRSGHKGWSAGNAIGRQIVLFLDYALPRGALALPESAELERMLDDLARRYAAAARRMESVMEREGLTPHKSFAAVLRKAPDMGAKLSAYLEKDELGVCLTGASRHAASLSAEAAYRELCGSAAEFAEKGAILRAGLEKLPFVALTAQLLEEFTAQQRRHGMLPALCIPALARRSMEEDGTSALLCRLGSRLTHILIDEFQDTSRTQWEALRPLALEALSRGGSFTWVGDVKQSVYNWRGGDAALFDELLHDPGLRAVEPEPLSGSLPANWRSREEIVRFNNALFSLPASPEHALTALEILMPETPPDILGKSAAELCRAFEGAAQVLPDREASRGGFVSLLPLRADDAASLNEEVDAALDQKLDEIGGRRSWGEIAVLVRSNEQASRITERLASRGIPVLTENSLLLARHPLVAQSVAFLRFAHNPLDDLAFWEFCTSALCADLAGLSVEELHAWAACRPRGVLCERFQEAFPHVWTRFFAPFFDCGLLTPYDLLQEFFAFFGVWRRFPEDAVFLRRLLEVVHAAEGQGHASLAAFLDSWEKGGMEEKLPMPEGMDAVRVMTIHKAKGLEFPVVIVPGTHFSLRPDAPVTEYVFERGPGEEALRFLAPRRSESADTHYPALAAAARELLHLLYVAFTRAGDELHVFLTGARGSSRQRKSVSSVLEAWLPELGIRPDQPCSRGGTPVFGNAPVCRAASSGFVLSSGHGREESPGDSPFVTAGAAVGSEDPPPLPMSWLPRLRIHRAELFDARMTGAPLHPRVRGILAHRCLEFLLPTGKPGMDAENALLAGERALRTRLSEEERESLARGLLWYAGLPEAAAWAEWGSPEHSLLDPENRLHRMDMLVDEGERITVLEYKSGRESSAHAEQLRRYLDLLERACGKKASGLLIYLDLRICRAVGSGSEKKERGGAA